MKRFELLVGIAALVVLAACGVPAQREAQVAGTDSVPFALLEPNAPPLVPPATAITTDEVSLCFVRDGRLVVLPRQLDAPVGLQDAIEALAQPPEGEEQVRTVLSDSSVVREVRLSAGIARVDLRQAISSLGGDDQLLAMAQLVCTLTARPGVGQVSFSLEGTPVDVPRGDGSLVAAPVSRDDYAALLP